MRLQKGCFRGVRVNFREKGSEFPEKTMMGEARPKRLFSTEITPEAHNSGNTDSGYVSWSLAI
jgi:hypothetical protein